MATEMQEKALDAVVEAGRTKKRIIKGQVLRSVGYSEAVATQPDKVFKSKGFLDLCDELGLTEDLLTTALVDDIKSKPKNRKAELELGFKVRGLLKERDNGGTTNNIIVFGNEQSELVARRLLARSQPSEEESS